MMALLLFATSYCLSNSMADLRFIKDLLVWASCTFIMSDQTLYVYISYEALRQQDMSMLVSTGMVAIVHETAEQHILHLQLGISNSAARRKLYRCAVHAFWFQISPGHWHEANACGCH